MTSTTFFESVVPGWTILGLYGNEIGGRFNEIVSLVIASPIFQAKIRNMHQRGLPYWLIYDLNQTVALAIWEAVQNNDDNTAALRRVARAVYRWEKTWVRRRKRGGWNYPTPWPLELAEMKLKKEVCYE